MLAAVPRRLAHSYYIDSLFAPPRLKQTQASRVPNCFLTYLVFIDKQFGKFLTAFRNNVEGKNIDYKRQ